MIGAVLCTNKSTMNSFLRRVSPNTLLFALYFAVVAFALICWKGMI